MDSKNVYGKSQLMVIASSFAHTLTILSEHVLIDRSSTPFVGVYSIRLMEPMRVHSYITLDAKLPVTWSQVLHNFSNS